MFTKRLLINTKTEADKLEKKHITWSKFLTTKQSELSMGHGKKRILDKSFEVDTIVTCYT